ncbi:MAG TPA: hypothetical protein IAC12_02385 [Candidatus Aphodovivens avistercoris]|nr:hypothetical protein [Candidatus Aphodovivens avistercoris]
MRIAVASDGLDVASYFGAASSFMCYTVTRGIITECQNLPNPHLAIDGLIKLFHEVGVDILIVGRIEYDVANVLCHGGIEVVAGAQGNAADVARAYLSKTLTGVEAVCHLDDPGYTLGEEHTAPSYA